MAAVTDRTPIVTEAPRCSWCLNRDGHRPNCPRPDERYTAFDLAQARAEAAQRALDDVRTKVEVAIAGLNELLSTPAPHCGECPNRLAGDEDDQRYHARVQAAIGLWSITQARLAAHTVDVDGDLGLLPASAVPEPTDLRASSPPGPHREEPVLTHPGDCPDDLRDHDPGTAPGCVELFKP